MLLIDNNQNITLTRGDTLTLRVELMKDGSEYVPEEGDSVRFALSIQYKNQLGYELILSKEIPTDTLTFTASSAETALDYREYNYDIEITHADGSVDTFISAKLRIVGEVM